MLTHATSGTQDIAAMVASLKEVYGSHLRLAITNTLNIASNREIAARASIAARFAIAPSSPMTCCITGHHAVCCRMWSHQSASM
ncbi:MAG: hypothetical protein R3D29_02030 [Nitratireductor sp.]